MHHLRKVILSLLVSLCISCFFYFFLTNIIVSPKKKTSPPVLSLDVNVIARIGEYELNSISGWTSPFAIVSLNSPGLARKTNADDKGFFIFTNVLVRSNLSEICLFSQDPFGISANPVCLAPQDVLDGLIVKDILLPPTILVDKEKFTTAETAKASGMTFPNSEVIGNLFFGKKTALTLVATSNENGKYEISLPGSLPSTNRIYVFSILNPQTSQSLGFLGKMLSPKSNILTFFISSPYWLYVIPFLFWLFVFLFLFFFYHKNYRNRQLIKYEPNCETKFISGTKILKF